MTKQETVAIIDYGSGNIRSAQKALEYAGSQAKHRYNITVTNRAEDIVTADRIILPGVGAFGDCRRGLFAVPGMVDALDEAVRTHGKPFLGICVGMQLLAKDGYEHGAHEGLGWLEATVGPLEPAEQSLKIPHMGWNALSLTGTGTTHPVTRSLNSGDHAYFVHSYHMTVASTDDVLATTEYGTPITAIVGQDNFVGTQFHPEKSQSVGLAFLQAFLEWSP